MKKTTENGKGKAEKGKRKWEVGAPYQTVQGGIPVFRFLISVFLTRTNLFVRVLLLCFLPSPTWAAIAHVQTGKANNSANTTHAVVMPAAVGANNLLVAGIVFGDDNTTTATISGGCSVAWTVLSGPNNQTVAGNLFRGYLWQCRLATGGATTATVTLTVSKWACMQVEEISGHDTTTPLDQVAVAISSAAGTTATSPTVTTTQANEILVGFGGNMWTWANTLTAGTGYTLPVNGDNDSSGNGQWSGMEYRIVSATGNYNAVFTFSNSNHWMMYIATFKEATGGGGPAPKRLTLLGVG